MGITGLIPFLEKASSKVHLRDLRGCTVAVDTYCWLHKGVYSCAEKLVRGEETDLYLQYCLKYVQLLLSYDIKPILVFDGRHLPAKALTERRRRESRQQSKKRAAELLRLGRTEEARSQMRRCVDVTHEMALRLIRECRQRNVDCIVAPYEADAQMAWLNKADVAQYIVTEDSDLTLFGARKVIFKLDLTGSGLLVQADKLYLAMGCSAEKYTFDKFRRMCILSGCDYLDSLPGIGLAKACKFILKTEEEDAWRALKKIPQYLNMRNLEVNDEYIENFLKAEATFKHMYIYNPLKRKIERMQALAECETEERFCSNAGEPMEDDEQALQLALGNLNPFTLKQVDNWHPDRDFGPAKHIARAKHKSIWQTNFQKHSIDKVIPSEQQRHLNCALFFSKVDFNAKSIGAEIDANIREENAKPEEGDIYTMYKQGATTIMDYEAPCKKRRYSNSSSCSNESNGNIENFVLSGSATKTHQNPFIKSQTPTKQNMQPTASICKNSSLLGVLSPKKNQTNTFSNKLKRSIFATDDKPPPPQVEVKSRFFAANLQAAKKSAPSTPTTSVDLTEDIDSIDNLSQKNHATQLQLYESPSPRKKIAHAIISDDDQQSSLLNRADSGIESIESMSTDSNFGKDQDAIADGTVEQCVKTANEIEAAVILSDDDDDFEALHSAANESHKRFSVFKSQVSPRFGLSKTKSRSTKSSKVKSNRKVLIASAATTTQNQTRLSMFGFQKRPTLK